ncbi:MAG TPA: hypothetical protein VGQ62_13675 [Chloroflexota bacterium]|nr:hypothetical protein [Chloroflexota bacterium]
MSGDILPTVIGIALVAAAAAFALLPFARGPRADPLGLAESVSSKDRYMKYRRILELEFDYELGKLSAEDYASQSAELLGEAGLALRAERGTLGEVDAEIEREIAAARAAFSAARRSAAERVGVEPEPSTRP